MMFQLLRNEYSNAGIISNQKYNKTVFNKKTQKEENRKFEYDFIIKSENPKEILVIELKGYHSKYKIPLGDFETENSIKWFFCYTFPIIKEKYKEIFKNILTENIAIHCGSGVTACNTLLALDYAGLEIPNLYVGSWSEWSRNDKIIATNI